MRKFYLIFLAGLIAGTAMGQTGLTGIAAGPFLDSTGQPITNQVLMYAWPVVSQWALVGTNIVWEAAVVTNQPNIMANQIVPGPAGYFTNELFPGNYAVKVPALGPQVFFYAAVPSSPAQVPLSSCVTDVPVFFLESSAWDYATNLFGGEPG
ncbi:MAG: hypothetical protein ACRED1_05985, partial [Limisphaerales bacterium]